MKAQLKAILMAIKQFLVNWNEFITVPLAFILFWLGGALIRCVDPTAGLFDPGIFQIIIFAIAAFLLLHGAAWFILKITFPSAYRFIDSVFDDMNNEHQGALIGSDYKLTKYQKCVLILLYFSVCLLAMVLLARVIM
jgi:hypothetical protein